MNQFKTFVILILMYFNVHVFSQASVYASFFGDDALLAANVDFRSDRPGWIDLSWRMGVGVWDEFGGGKTTYSFPHHLTVLLGRTHAFEAGASAAYRLGVKPHYRLNSVIGYRYQRRPQGLLIRAYIHPIVFRTFHYRFGLGIGHSF